MTPRRTEPTAQQRELLARTIRDVVRFHRLSADEAQDFQQRAQLGTPERQYEIFAQYRGRSSLRTYLIVVVMRMLLDWRNAKYRQVAHVTGTSSSGRKENGTRLTRRE